jgi:hypothetical protein
MDHLEQRHPSYMRGFTFPFSLSVPLPVDVNLLVLTETPQFSTPDLFKKNYFKTRPKASFDSWVEHN